MENKILTASYQATSSYVAGVASTGGTRTLGNALGKIEVTGITSFASAIDSTTNLALNFTRNLYFTISSSGNSMGNYIPGLTSFVSNLYNIPGEQGYVPVSLVINPGDQVRWFDQLIFFSAAPNNGIATFTVILNYRYF